MSQGQQQRRHDDGDSIIYGDVSNVSGYLASEPITPLDAAAVQTTENTGLGHRQRNGPAFVMQPAGINNKREPLVSSRDVSDDDTIEIVGVTVSETVEASNLIITESIGGEVVGRFAELDIWANTQGGACDADSVTIGEALEATALSAGDKPVEQSDASAIQAAEVRATGGIKAGGLAAVAQSAATLNARTLTDECKTKLSDVLTDASAKLPADKAVTPEDAERVICAQVRNDPEMSTASAGVAASMAAAARLNENMSL